MTGAWPGPACVVGSACVVRDSDIGEFAACAVFVDWSDWLCTGADSVDGAVGRLDSVIGRHSTEPFRMRPNCHRVLESGFRKVPCADFLSWNAGIGVFAIP